jgi:hypothetical protein
MNWGRLLYLRRVQPKKTMKYEKEWEDLFSIAYEDCLQKTVLERPTDFQKLVLAFLNTL